MLWCQRSPPNDEVHDHGTHFFPETDVFSFPRYEEQSSRQHSGSEWEKNRLSYEIMLQKHPKYTNIQKGGRFLKEKTISKKTISEGSRMSNIYTTCASLKAKSTLGSKIINPNRIHLWESYHLLHIDPGEQYVDCKKKMDVSVMRAMNSKSR